MSQRLRKGRPRKHSTRLTKTLGIRLTSKEKKLYLQLLEGENKTIQEDLHAYILTRINV